LAKLVGGDAPHGLHCLEAGDPPRVYRVYAPGPRTKIPAIVAAVRQIADDNASQPRLAPWVANRLYGLAVLVSSGARESRLRSALRTAGLQNDLELLVSIVPDAYSLGKALHALRGREAHAAVP